MGQIFGAFRKNEENDPRWQQNAGNYGQRAQTYEARPYGAESRTTAVSATQRYFDDHFQIPTYRSSSSNRTVVIGSTPLIGNDVYTKDELKRLLSKAERHLRGRDTKTRLKYFYRDKSKAYYDDIMHNMDGIMEVYKKDFHGDPKNPINGRLMGLFMSVNVQYGTSEPVFSSVYGEKRLLLDPETMYQRCPNLYFADFYCIHKPHYVTLVMTRPGSDADRFCQRYLIRLEWDCNPFLERRWEFYQDAPSYYVVNCGLWIEVFFTEDIDVLEATKKIRPLFNVEMKGFRSGGTKGLRKKADCTICNI